MKSQSADSADKNYKLDMGKNKGISREVVLFFILTMFMVCSDAKFALTPAV